MRREVVTVDSMIEHIDGFEDLVDKIDHAWRQSHAASKAVAANRERVRVELKAVDGELAAIYDRLTIIADEIEPLISAKSRLDAVLQQLVEMAATQAQIAERVAHLRATPSPSMAHMRDTQVAVDATMERGEGLLLLLAGKVCAISLEELGVYLGLTDELSTPLTPRALGDEG